MARQVKRVLNSGTFDPKELVRLLNQGRYGERVGDVLDLLARIYGHAQARRAKGDSTGQLPNEDQQLENRVNATLSEFASFPVITIAGDSILPGQQPAIMASPEALVVRKRTDTKQALHDWYVVQLVMDAIRFGIMDSVVRCRCGKWFVKRVGTQRFCSESCRTKEFRSSDEWKAHRREYMKKYYALKQSGKVK